MADDTASPAYASPAEVPDFDEIMGCVADLCLDNGLEVDPSTGFPVGPFTVEYDAAKQIIHCTAPKAKFSFDLAETDLADALGMDADSDSGSGEDDSAPDDTADPEADDATAAKPKAP